MSPGGNQVLAVIPLRYLIACQDLSEVRTDNDQSANGKWPHEPCEAAT